MYLLRYWRVCVIIQVWDVLTHSSGSLTVYTQAHICTVTCRWFVFTCTHLQIHIAESVHTIIYVYIVIYAGMYFVKPCEIAFYW